jgi:hypothetical protein
MLILFPSSTKYLHPLPGQPYNSSQTYKWIGTIFFHQHGAAPHCGHHVLQFMNVTFPDRWFARFCYFRRRISSIEVRIDSHGYRAQKECIEKNCYRHNSRNVERIVIPSEGVQRLVWHPC